MPDLFELIVMLIALMSLPLLIWMIVASISVNTTFAKYNRISSKSGMTARQAARKILDANGLFNVQISTCRGTLTDHYDPRNNTVYLSNATCESTSLAAIGVAAHEVGHAIQHAEEYAPIRFRSALVPVVNVMSKFVTPLLLIGIILEFITYVAPVNISAIFYMGALICYGAYCVFTLVTLPCEYNASRRAKIQLAECGILDDQEITVTAKVLNSAAKTYLVSFLFSLAQFARILLLLLNSRRRD